MVKEARERLGITQEALADKIGVSYAAISQWERNKKPIPLKRQKQLADVFNMTPDEIRDGVARNVRLEERFAWVQAVGAAGLSITAEHIILRLVLDESLCRVVNGALEFTGTTQDIVKLSTNLTAELVQRHMPELVASPFVTRIGGVEWHLQLKLPQ
jgi:transcriptional regulator with XRE-family HTH domain